MEIDFQRQTALFNPEQFADKHVTIIGLGNIGSHAALTLARMGIRRFTLFDPDTIEKHNLSSQSYSQRFIGTSKVSAIREQIQDIDAMIQVQPIQSKFDQYPDDPIITDIIVIGVDSLKARREIAKQLIKSKFTGLIIDGRIGGEQLELYSSKSPQDWQKTIPAGKPAPDICGGQYICYVSVIIGGLIGCQVKKYLTQQAWDKSIMLNVPSLQVAKNFEW